MTKQEAIEILEEVKELDDTMYAYNPVYMNALDIAISALKEIQQYREIGTVEECREAVERQKPKKIEVVNIENFVVNKLYVPYLAKILKNTEDFGNKITGKENILKYFEECDMVRKLQIDPNLIIQLFDDRPDIKEIAFNVLKESGGVKWYRYLDMNNPVIRWVNENLEGMEDENT